MFRRRRNDTRVETIERAHGINLHARGDMLLGNLLDERGFDSLSQLLKAYHGRLTTPARKRRLFLSFHGEDRAQVSGLRLMARNPRLEFDFYDGSLTVPINSDDGAYVRRLIRHKIQRTSVIVCLIGNGTAWRDWVDWELRVGLELKKGLCGVRLKESRGRAPQVLSDISAPIAAWDTDQIIATIECAAASRS